MICQSTSHFVTAWIAQHQAALCMAHEHIMRSVLTLLRFAVNLLVQSVKLTLEGSAKPNTYTTKAASGNTSLRQGRASLAISFICVCSPAVHWLEQICYTVNTCSRTQPIRISRPTALASAQGNERLSQDLQLLRNRCQVSFTVEKELLYWRNWPHG